MTLSRLLPIALTLLAAACGAPVDDKPPAAPPPTPIPEGRVFVVRDTTVAQVHVAPAIAEPITEATVATKLMGTVTAVLVREGDLVRNGQVLARIDARDLAARQEHVTAGIAAAEAARGEALLQMTRVRALVADSAAPRAHLDAAEAGLVRAEAGVRMARAGEAELAANTAYATIRSPSAGVVTRRWVDVGAFAAPGAPLITVQDQSSLRVAATVEPNVARRLRRGALVDVAIEGQLVSARVEAVIPAPVVGLYTVNAIVANRAGRLIAGGASAMHIVGAPKSVVLVPEAAIQREGDLTGVVLAGVASGNAMRWVRLGGRHGELREVVAGLVAGDRILLMPGRVE